MTYNDTFSVNVLRSKMAKLHDYADAKLKISFKLTKLSYRSDCHEKHRLVSCSLVLRKCKQ